MSTARAWKKSASASSVADLLRGTSGPSISYVGRFAPSPSGPLHAGSLVAALASWLDARAHGGRWLLRIEDIDAARCDHKLGLHICETLHALGLHWDGPVMWQSERLERYDAVLEALKQSDRVFPCACTRRHLQPAADASGEKRYPGHCRQGMPAGETLRSWRFRIEDGAVPFTDRLLGPQVHTPAQQCGDMVVHRADGLFAYQLVVVIDDADQGVTDVVRGADLLTSTGRQILLQRALGAAQPRYMHIPLLTGHDGAKLSKQNGAEEIPWQHRPADCLNQALEFLGFPPQTGSVSQILESATEIWRTTHVAARPAPK